MKKAIAVLIALCMLLCACAGADTTSTTSQVQSSTAPEVETEVDVEALIEEFFSQSAVVDTGLAYDVMPQLDSEVSDDTTVVTLTTNYGDIKIRMFSDIAPVAVANFVTHCENGYYDDTPFHRVMEDFMIQGGDPTGNGTGGESIWGGRFDDELSDNLHHFRGAVSMANSGANTNRSQFFIVHDNTVTQKENLNNLLITWYYNELKHQLNEIVSRSNYTQAQVDALVAELNSMISYARANGVPEEFKERYLPAAERYIENGGAYYLDYGYTIFGQVIEGMDVVDAIAAVEVEATARGELSMPVEEVYIISTAVSKTK